MKTQINLFDRKSKTYVRLKPSESGWERFISKTKKTWKKTHAGLTFEQAIKYQQQVIDNNFLNLFHLITKK